MIRGFIGTPFCKSLSFEKFLASSLKIVMAAAEIANGSLEMHFKQIEQKSELFPVVKEELQKRALVYGNQEESLKKLEEGVDRTCELLLKDVKPLTVLIYKVEPVSKTESVEVTDSLEVKTLFPIDKSLTNEYLSKTLDRAIEIAKEKNAKNIHLTCSEREKSTFNFLINNNFKVYDTLVGKYVDGVKEYLMYKSLKDIKEEENRSCGDKCEENNKVEPEKNDESDRKRKFNDEDRHDNKRGRYDDNRGRSHGERDRDRNRRRYDNGQREKNNQRSKNFDDSCTLMKKYVHYIKNGKKTVEGRLNVPMFQKWREGMTIRFHYRNPTDDVYVKILRVKLYKSFKEMLEAEGVRNCIPDVHTVNEGVRAYLNIPRYKERENLGVLAFRMQMVDKP